VKHPVEHLRFQEAAVEAVAEFRQVAGQMLVADAVVDTTDIALDIGDQGMDPGQDLQRLGTRTGNQPFMAAGRTIQDAVTLPAVGAHHHLCCQAFLNQGLDFGGRSEVRL
jgi:hypothetical protein